MPGAYSALVSRRHAPSFNSNSGAPPRNWTLLAALRPLNSNCGAPPRIWTFLSGLVRSGYFLSFQGVSG